MQRYNITITKKTVYTLHIHNSHFIMFYLYTAPYTPTGNKLEEVGQQRDAHEGVGQRDEGTEQQNIGVEQHARHGLQQPESVETDFPPNLEPISNNTNHWV